MADEADKIKEDVEHPIDHGKPAAAGKPGSGPGAKKKGGDHKEAIIVILSTIGVIIAWLTYKRSTGAAAATSTSTGATAPTYTSGSGSSSGDVAGYGDSTGDTSAGNGFQSYLQNLSDEITQLTSANGTLSDQIGSVQTTLSSLPSPSQPITTPAPTGAASTPVTAPPATYAPAPAPTAPIAKPAPIAAVTPHAGPVNAYTSVTNGQESILSLAKVWFGPNVTANQINDLRVQNNMRTTPDTSLIAAGTTITVPTADRAALVKKS